MRFSPASVCHADMRSRPVTTTRMPLRRLLPMFSASVFHAVQDMNSGSASRQPPVSLSKRRGLLATANLHTAAPEGR